MEVSQPPGQRLLRHKKTETALTAGQVEEPPGHRWAKILGTGVAIVTLTLPLIMIAYSSPFGSNAQTIPQTTFPPQIRVRQME